MTERTPGPWRAEGPDPFGDYNILHPADSLAIGAVVSNMRPPEEVAANAAFIVRAVNSHDALVKLLRQAQNELMEHGSNRSFALNLAAQIDAALQQADRGAT